MRKPIGDRVFPDTNVLLSGLLFGGNESRLLTLAAQGKFTLLLGEIVLRETERVLARKFPTQTAVLPALLAAIPHQLIPLPNFAELEPYRNLLTDPADIPVLASAVKGRAGVLVSGDAHFFRPEVQKIIPVLRGADYLKRFFDR
jgi:putative PIN family toxin of toxin-antitoxin system